ncbi:MAG TPA: hypothetical protein VH087_17205 [Thermoanaerobaculia bacterium]|jgi:hypothetical protein|nr:hypothetical protein [Thermoanaerobaculia bacterium]
MRAAWRVVTLLIAALLTLTFATRFLLIEYFFTRAGGAIAFALLEALAIAGAGHLARRRRAGLALSFVLGYPIFGTLCFLVGLLKVNGATMGLVTVALALAGIFAVYENRQLTTDNSFALPAALVLILGFIAAQAPPSSLDELAYHLAVPHAWVIAGRAIALPLISHSYFPLGIESADLPPLTLLGALAGGIASHFLHLIVAIATTVVVHRRTRNALLTAAIVTTPALALTAGWSLVDWPLLGICVAFLDDDEREPALAAGLLTKYTFLPFALIAVLLPTGEGGVKRRMRGVALGAIAGSVFFIRNLILTGSPIAPFLTAHAPHVSNYRDLTLGSYIFDGRFLDESLGASLLAALTAISGPVAIALLVAGALIWATAPSARLLVPFFGAAATDAKLESRALRVVLVIAVIAQLFLVAYYIDRTDAFSLLAAKQTDAEYLTKARPSHASVAWLNAALPKGSSTLVVGLNETYWFDHRVLGGGNFDGDRISAYLDAPTPEALRARLSNDRVDHIAVFSAAPPTADVKKQEERQTQLTPAAQKTLALLLDRDAAEVTSHRDVTLFTLR